MTPRPHAVYAFHQPDWDNGPGFPMFNVIGGPLDRSTVSAETLIEAGIPVPEFVPETADPRR